MINLEFIQKFQVPEVAYPFIDHMFTEQEIQFVAEMNLDVFTQEDMKNTGIQNTDEFIQNSYRRGIISIVDLEKGLYKISDFYGRLDIFSISETDTYRSFPEEAREAFDGWYFEAYYNGLDGDPLIRPTQDEILPLEDVITFIESQDRPVFLNYCDCRSLRGECGLPTKTCITYKNGINSFVHRGLSEQIDKEKAKEIVKKADKAGLMHTVNPNGICNCCGDCCYLFRGQDKRNSLGFWPKTENIITMNSSQCIVCGKCTRTCHFGVFTKNGKILVEEEKCVGCGICVQACPTGALKLKGR
ncbi:MAG: 4Fe-4S ferredoxin, iron-sulfur binding domain protein [Herbinix sp.]|jgi:NAD-dependent dihydropyrimidine dehydrogenase PreA subunit|nr:4Fe-4S ferredoxin, iron-sulfur binding domain protein [Herbinix sp.]